MSKTMNVPEVTTLYECLRMVIKHSESSVKNKETFDNIWRSTKWLYIFYLGAKLVWPISWNPAMSLMGCLQLYMLCILKLFVLMNRISCSVWWMFTFWKSSLIYSLSLKEHSSVKLTKWICLWPECLICQTLLPHHWNLWQQHPKMLFKIRYILTRIQIYWGPLNVVVMYTPSCWIIHINQVAM